MYKLLVLLMMYSMAYSVNTPYFSSATALSDSSVLLTWRNNDLASIGFVITRKDTNQNKYTIIDSVKSASTFSYIDQKNTQPASTYMYQVLAYSADAISDTSNSQQVTTLDRPLKKPGISVYWNYDTSSAVKITIFDSSAGELEYRIYRDEEFFGSFSTKGQIVSTNPLKMDTITWYDTTISLNKWYNYKVAVFSSKESLFSAPCSTFTYRYLPPQQRPLVRFTKICDFPVSVSGGMSAKAGDSLIIKEVSSPAGKFSVINIKDPSHPQFDGYIDSTTLLSYPLKTLIPVFLKFRVANRYNAKKVIGYGDRILVVDSEQDNLKMYQIQNDTLFEIDTQSIERTGMNPTILLLNDTVVIFRYENFYSHMGLLGTEYSLSLSSSGFQWSHYWGFVYCPNIRGLVDNRILSSYGCDLDIYDQSLKRSINLKNSGFSSANQNNNYSLSAYEYLCVNSSTTPANAATEIYVSDIRDPHSYDFDLGNNAVYRDSAHKGDTIQNIILDTLSRRVFLIFNTVMTVLEYQHDYVGVNHVANRPSRSLEKLAIISTPSCATIITPFNQHTSELNIYDLSGRVIDKIQNITSNTIRWRPKSKSSSCYIAVVKSGDKILRAKFFLR